MARTVSAAVLQPCRRPVAACVASLFALAAPAAAIADTWTVNSCDEGSSGDTGTKTGTLRYALAHATSPAFIDLSGLSGASACPGNKISLSTLSGELETSLATVTLNGPGPDTLTIDASGLPPSYGDARVLAHTGAGKLTIQNLGVTGGHVYHAIHPVLGGCIFSAGDVELDNSKVSSCYATSKDSISYTAVGGGIFATKTLTLNNSTVTQCSARTVYSTAARGGGVYAGSTLTLSNYASVNQSYAKSNGGLALGGGAYSKGATMLNKASIYLNHTYSGGAYAKGGGLYTVGDLTVTGAYIGNNSTQSTIARAYGGGLYAKGNSSVTQAFIKYNTAASLSTHAYGGGAFVHGNFTLTRSQLRKNQVSSPNPFSSAGGGGAQAMGVAFISYSTISDNKANGPGVGGGLLLEGDLVTIDASTVSGNTADGFGAGVVVFTGAASAAKFKITRSTVSGNSTIGTVGGLYIDSGSAKFYNTTIAFNTSTGAGSSPGVRLKAPSPSMAVTLENTLMSNNTFGTNEADLDAAGANPLVFNGGDLATQANNLIRVTSISAAVLPGDTKQGFCPHLGRLRDNGGLTRTHALLSHSVAIDAGNDNLGVFYDQRGAAVVNGTIDYPLPSGPSGSPNPKPDIGAYEVQQDDVVFDTDFEDCVPPPV